MTQTLLPAELIVSDDGSSDDTLNLVRTFAKRAPFPVIILDNQERLGFADNFLRAAEACSHRLIAYCDQDDVWLPEKLELAHQKMTSDGSLLSLHRLIVVDEAVQPYGYWDQDITTDRVAEPLQLDPYITGWGNTMLFERDLVHLIPRAKRPPHPQSPGRLITHDTWVYVLAAALGRVTQIYTPLIHYRQHGTNAAGVELDQDNIRRRLRDWITVPIYMFHEQFSFYDRMAVLFGELADDGIKPLAGNAQAARNRFIARRDLLATRLTVFEGSSLFGRMRAFVRLQHMPRDTAPWLGAQAKELVLGVAGLHLLRQRLTELAGRQKT